MSSTPADPFRVLGVAASASDDEIHTAYRRLAMRHHPDRNGGSAESAVRFAEIQEAYAHVRLLRRTATIPANPGGTTSADIEARIAAMEGELRRARTTREQADRRLERLARLRRTSAQAPAPTPADSPTTTGKRPSDEELGYVSTHDSFSSILDDLADRLTGEDDVSGQ